MEPPKAVVLIDLAKPDEPRVVAPFADARAIVWDRAGERLAIVGPVISVHDPDNPFAHTEFAGPADPVGDARFTADGLLVAGDGGSFRVWDPPARGIALTLPGRLVAGRRPVRPDRPGRLPRGGGTGPVGGVAGPGLPAASGGPPSPRATRSATWTGARTAGSWRWPLAGGRRVRRRDRPRGRLGGAAPARRV